MDYTTLTDKQLIAHVRDRGNLTPVESELSCRLERALDELDLCVRAHVQEVRVEEPTS